MFDLGTRRVDMSDLTSHKSDCERHGETVPDGAFDIVVIGPYPPPLGGVSSHVARVVTLLESAGFRVGVLNHFRSKEAPVVIGVLKRNPLRYFVAARRTHARLFHYHHSRPSMLIALGLSQRRSVSSLVVTIHGRLAARRLQSRIPFVSRMTRWALGRFDRIIVVNRETKDELRGQVSPDRLVVLPAFVPATEQEAAEYPPEWGQFFRSGRVMLVAGYRVQLLSGGRDLYGLDLAVDAFLALAVEDPDLKLAVLLAQAPALPRQRLFVRRLRRRIQAAGFDERVLWAAGLPLVPALQHDVVLVRPTRLDGDAVSIREALEAGVPVVASDVVGRPGGVVTFRSEAVEELCSAVREALQRLQRRGPHRPAPAAGNHDDFAQELLGLYRELLADVSAPSLEASVP